VRKKWKNVLKIRVEYLKIILLKMYCPKEDFHIKGKPA
jgi:hypothetical protein